MLRTLLTVTFAGLSLALLAPCSRSQKPGSNVVFLMADDLGYGDLGSYGQSKIKTPQLDRLAAEGMRFTQHYAGSTVCAPSRCVLLTGRHSGQAWVRGNYEMGGWEQGNREGQLALPEGSFTLGRLFKNAGYATCAIGKWGLGGPHSTGHPNRQGFDHWFGYLCQRHAHNYYPTHLWRNETRVELEGNAWKKLRGKHYAPDLMIREALQWIRANKDRPFFLYYPTPVPHLALQVPEQAVAEYHGMWEDPPYDGKRGYLPHPSPRAAYAAMISRMDHDIGRILNLLDELKLSDNTIVFFTSDNGATFNLGGADSSFFDSCGGLRGRKCSLYEGGIRVPMIVRWPGKIAAGTQSSVISMFTDFLPSFAEILGEDTPDDLPGLSLVPTWTGQGRQQQHPWLYWEYHAGGGSQAVRLGQWKALRQRIRQQEDAPIELYDLSQDRGESKDIAKKHPDLVERIRMIMDLREPSPIPRWNLRKQRSRKADL
ncbi:MAG: N-acetylgalactosamine-6-sulfatase [Planctomycetota bacterium]|nr:MAG: N-acetylgalactosamine-6-sulfatase [Planctomycetota bacterium]